MTDHVQSRPASPAARRSTAHVDASPAQREALFAARAFVLLLTYVDARPAGSTSCWACTATWLDEHFADGTFLVSGPQVPRTGGAILAQQRVEGADRGPRLDGPAGPRGRRDLRGHRVPPHEGPLRPMRAAPHTEGALMNDPQTRGHPRLPRADGPRPPRRPSPRSAAGPRRCTTGCSAGPSANLSPTHAWPDGTASSPPSPCSSRSATPPLSCASTSALRSTRAPRRTSSGRWSSTRRCTRGSRERSTRSRS